MISNIIIRSNMIMSDFMTKIKGLWSAYQERNSYAQFIQNHEKIVTQLQETTKNDKISMMLSYLFEWFSKNKSKNHKLSDLVYSLMKRVNGDLYAEIICNQIQEMLKEKNQEQIGAVSEKALFLSNFLVDEQQPIAEYFFNSCKTSQILAQKILKLICDNVINRLSENKKMKGNLTQPFLLSISILLNCQRVRQPLLSQALRFLTIACHIQFQQFEKILTKEDEILLNKILGLISRNYTNGYLFGLIAVIINRINQVKYMEQLKLLIKQTNSLVKVVFDGKTQLPLEIQKIKASKQPQTIKFSLLTILRGAALYIHEVTFFHNNLGFTQQLQDQIMQLLSVKDFFVHAMAIKSVPRLILPDKFFLNQLDAQYFERCILTNYLPNSLQYRTMNQNQQYFLKGTYGSYNLCLVSKDSSQIQKSFLLKILERRNINQNGIYVIPQFIEDIIHQQIQNQYDHQFNEYQFLTAINLLIAVIELIKKNIKDLNVQNTELIQPFKEQITNYAKMLLNLNESCLPESKMVINDKIYEVLISFPHILFENPFLQQVLENLLISKLPKSSESLLKLTVFYAQHKNQIFNQESSPKCLKRNYQQFIDKINTSLFDKVVQNNLSIRQKALLWKQILYVFKNNSKRQQIFSIYKNKDNQLLSKLLAINNYNKVQKDTNLKEDKSRATTIGQKLSKYEDIFNEELQVIFEVLFS